MDWASGLHATTPALIDLAMLIGRVFVGLCLVVHGLGKLGIVGPGSMPGFVAWLTDLGFPAPALQARLAMATELIGGAMIAGGFLMRPAAAACLVTMMVAALFGHRGGGYLVTNDPPGNEYPLNLAAVLLVFILIGPGSFSLDALLFPR